jgi:signal transduction histidine kinase
MAAARTLSRALVVGFAATAALVVAVLVTSVLLVDSSRRHTESVASAHTQDVVLAERLRTAAAGLEAVYQDVALRQGRTSPAELERRTRRFDTLVAELRAHVTSGEGALLLDGVVSAHHAYRAEVDAIAASEARGEHASLERLFGARLELDRHIDLLVHHKEQRHLQSQIGAAHHGALVLGGSIGGAALTVAAVAGLGFWLTRSLRHRLEESDARRLEAERARADALVASGEAERAREAAEAAIRIREDLLAIVSHDLRNPLMVVTTGLSLLVRMSPKGDEGSRLRAKVATMQRAGDRMTALIRDLLDAARIEAGRLDVETRPARLAELVDRAAELFTAPVLAKQLTLEVEVDEELMTLCEPERVIQLLSNLLGNAVKFTPDGGQVRVSATRRDPWVHISVSDSGPGIDADQLERLFKRFSHGQRTPGTGTGLGLFIAKGIVDAHGGQITARSSPGTGTTMELTLPSFVEDSTPESSEARLAAEEPPPPVRH